MEPFWLTHTRDGTPISMPRQAMYVALAEPRIGEMLQAVLFGQPIGQSDLTRMRDHLRSLDKALCAVAEDEGLNCDAPLA